MFQSCPLLASPLSSLVMSTMARFHFLRLHNQPTLSTVPPRTIRYDTIHLSDTLRTPRYPRIVPLHQPPATFPHKQLPIETKSTCQLSVVSNYSRIRAEKSLHCQPIKYHSKFANHETHLDHRPRSIITCVHSHQYINATHGTTLHKFVLQKRC